MIFTENIIIKMHHRMFVNILLWDVYFLISLFQHYFLSEPTKTMHVTFFRYRTIGDIQRECQEKDENEER